MRLGYKTSGAAPPRNAKQEPLAEGICKGAFSEQELETIRQTRAELIKGGLTDRAISKSISKALHRSADTIDSKLRKMVKSGELPENPNKLKSFSHEELETISQKRNDLIQQGLTDKAISKALSTELHHTALSTYTTIRNLVKSDKLPQNPNKRTNLNPLELSTIHRIRSELINQGLTDYAISKALSTELHRSPGSIRVKIHAMVKSGELPENPNSRNCPRFTSEDLEAIRQRRPELIRQGLTENAISKFLSKQLQRSVASMKEKMASMVKSGELPENPNKRGRKLPEGEILAQLKEAVGLYTEVSE